MTKKIIGIKEVLKNYNHFFFDLDGVLWKGDQDVPGSIDVLKNLRSQNKNLYFVTNSSLRGRQDLMKKFEHHHFQAKIQECFPSSYISTLYLKQKYPQIKRIMVFGTNELAEQFTIHGFDVKHIKNLQQVKTPIQIAHKYLDLTVQAIVVGWDSGMTFAKQCLIGFHLQNGIKFFGTNPDKYTMIGSYKVPGAGSIIASIQTGTSIKAQIIGKPNTFIIDHIIESKKLNKKQCVMIGDNIQTDITFGTLAGIDTVCVLSGVTTKQMINQINEQVKKGQQNIKNKNIVVPTYFSECLYQ